MTIKETLDKGGRTPQAYSLQSQKTGRSITHFTGSTSGSGMSSVAFGTRGEHRGYSGASAGRMLRMRDRSSGIMGAVRQHFGAPKLIEKATSKDGVLPDEDVHAMPATVKECPSCGETYTGSPDAHQHKAKTNVAAVAQIKNARANGMGALKSMKGVRDFVKAQGCEHGSCKGEECLCKCHMGKSMVGSTCSGQHKADTGNYAQCQKPTGHAGVHVGSIDNKQYRWNSVGQRTGMGPFTSAARGVKNYIHSFTNPEKMEQSFHGIRGFTKSRASSATGMPKPDFGINETDHFHENGCTKTMGPRGGVHTANIVQWRRNGATKTWKTRPGEFSIPVKHGLYGPHGYITHSNAHMFHAHDKCPTFEQPATP